MAPRARPAKAAPEPTGPAVFVRFVCFEQVGGQRSRMGLFQARDAAIGCDFAPDWAMAVVREAFGWFGDNLDRPTHYDRPGPRRGGAQDALCWFKAEAAEHIARMYELKAAFEACGIHVDVLRTRDPGRLVYEDPHQVAALPEHRRF